VDRRSTVTFFGPGPAFCFRSSLDQAAMAALGVVPPGVLGVVLPGTVANRSGDATPCSDTTSCKLLIIKDLFNDTGKRTHLRPH
jgi:hypothetical protein